MTGGPSLAHHTEGSMFGISRSALSGVLGVILATFGVVGAAASQDRPEAIIMVESPVAGVTVGPSDAVIIAGWALDPVGEGPGIDEIRVYIGGTQDEGGVAIGTALYGLPRPDVAEAYGRPDWVDVGYELTWFPGGMPAGVYPVVIYVHQMADDSWTYALTSVGGTAVAGPEPAPQTPPLATPPYAPVQPAPGGPVPGGPGPGGPLVGPGGAFPPILPPPGSAVTVFAVADPAGTIQLSWLPLEVASAYRIYMSTTGAPGGFSILRTVNQSLGSFNSTATIDRLNPGAPYVFQVRAVDSSGNELPVPATAGTGVGFNPTVIGTASTLGNVRIVWPPVASVSSYRVYRSESGGAGSFTVATTVNQSPGGATISAVVSGLTPGNDYFFQVRGIDSTGREIPIPGASIIGLDPFFTPINLSVAGIGATTVSLTWTPSPTPRVVSYRVYQAPGATNSFSSATVTNASQTSATIIGLIPNTAYSFQVTAIDADRRESGPSNTVTVTTTHLP